MTRAAFISRVVQVFCRDRYEVDEFIALNRAELVLLSPAEKKTVWEQMKAISRRKT